MHETAIEIEFMSAQQIAEVVVVHMNSFPGFFLTFLGSDFLYVLYCKMLNHPQSIMIVAVDKTTSHVVGLAAGVEDLSSFYKKLIKNNVAEFAAASLHAILRRPIILPRLIRALTYPSANYEASAPASLMSLGVLPGYAGQGIGRKMVLAFLDELKRRNITAVSLTTDRDNNERTRRFYTELGFELKNVFMTPEKRWLCEYFIDLKEDVSTGQIQPSGALKGQC